ARAGSLVSFTRWPAAVLEDGAGDVAGRLSGQFDDRTSALAATAQAALGAELVYCFGADCGLPHLADHAAAGTLVQALAQSSAAKEGRKHSTMKSIQGYTLIKP